MKTIEQAAIEYTSGKSSNFCFTETHKRDFKAGVEFATKWIDIDDELPTNQDLVLVKTDNNSVCTAYYHGDNSGFLTYGEDAFIDFGNIEYWRPIELI